MTHFSTARLRTSLTALLALGCTFAAFNATLLTLNGIA